LDRRAHLFTFVQVELFPTGVHAIGVGSRGATPGATAPCSDQGKSRGLAGGSAMC